jgi:hypothetical protein
VTRCEPVYSDSGRELAERMTQELEDEWVVAPIEGLDEELRVVDNGRVMCCVGLLASFYFLAKGKPEARERVVRAYEAYHAAIGDKLIWGADPKTHRPKKVAGTQIADVRSWAYRVAPDEELEFVFHGGKEKDDADAYRTIALVDPGPNDLSCLTFSLPLAWIAANTLGAFVKLVLDVCGILKPEHGYAGFGVIPHVNESGQSRAMTFIIALARRFVGLEVDFPVSHGIHLAKNSAIKGVNWLTVLGQTWVDKVGGEESLIQALGTGPKLHHFEGGIVIQAERCPRLGDKNMNEPMDAYRQVAKALKPIRTDKIRAFATGYGFNEERTTEWLRRFDD